MTESRLSRRVRRSAGFVSVCQPLSNLWLTALLMGAALCLASIYFENVAYPHTEKRLAQHEAIIEGTASAPSRYRVLMPAGVEVLSRGPLAWLERSRAVAVSQVLMEALAVGFSLATMWRLAALWFTRTEALVGTLLIALSMAAAFQDHHYQPWSLAEPGFTALVAEMIIRGRWRAGALTLMLSCLNRETGLFVVGLPLGIGFVQSRGAAIGQRLRTMARGLSLLGMGLALLIAVRLARGHADLPATLRHVWVNNLVPRSLVLAAAGLTVSFGLLALLAVVGWRRAPTAARCLLVTAPPVYLATALVWAVWTETRVLFGMYPALIVPALAALFTPQSTAYPVDAAEARETRAVQAEKEGVGGQAG